MSKLSVGGMGTVYRAEHTLIGKLAAVKVLHPELTSSREIVNRFFNEAKATTTIKHPGIVEVFDFGYMASGHAYLTMEFLEGMSLARRLKTKGRMQEGEAAMMLRAVCSALQAAHNKGIVHRDLKPDNIFMVNDEDSPTGDRPKVLDFGIAKLTDIGLAGTATKTGAVMGTPTYMSPEQCKGTGDVDHRADLYSIGCIFYELVVGRPPFTKLGAGELIGAHIYATPEPPSKFNPALSKETEKLIMWLLQKRPEKRPQTAKDLGQLLSQLAQYLGWITVTTPTGITARGLQELSTGPIVIAKPEVSLQQRFADSASPVPSLSQLTTPFGPDSAPNLGEPSICITHEDAPSNAEKPTTLSGAASQSVASIHDVPVRRSRKGLAFGLMSAALIAGAAVFAVKFVGGGDPKQVEAATSTPSTPSPPPKPPEPVKAPPEEPKPVEPNPVETKAVEPIEPVESPPPPVIVEQPKQPKRPPSIRKPVKAGGTKPTPTTKPPEPPKPPPKAECKPPFCVDKTPL